MSLNSNKEKSEVRISKSLPDDQYGGTWKWDEK